MRDFDERTGRSLLESLCVSLMMLSFGLGVLAYLIAIDRPEWFNLRPASGTAAAMANASDTAHRYSDKYSDKAQNEARP